MRRFSSMISPHMHDMWGGIFHENRQHSRLCTRGINSQGMDDFTMTSYKPSDNLPRPSLQFTLNRLITGCVYKTPSPVVIPQKIAVIMRDFQWKKGIIKNSWLMWLNSSRRTHTFFQLNVWFSTSKALLRLLFLFIYMRALFIPSLCVCSRISCNLVAEAKARCGW